MYSIAPVVATSSEVPGCGVVVDDDDLVDLGQGLEAPDALGDAVLLVVGREDDRECLALPHGDQALLRVGDEEHLPGEGLDGGAEVPRDEERQLGALGLQGERHEPRQGLLDRPALRDEVVADSDWSVKIATWVKSSK